MKKRSTTPATTSFATRACIVAAAVLTLAAAPMLAARPALADQYDEQIKAIQSQIDQYDKQAESLRKESDSYARELTNLNNQKAQIQAKLDLSVAKANQLNEQIKTNEQKIVDNKSVLGDTIADLYVDDSISPIELLASSESIADYVDKQSNREQVQNSVQDTIKQIDELKKELEKQKKEVDVQVANQKYAAEQLSSKEAEVAALRNSVEKEKSSYQKLSAKSQQQKDAVQQQQQEAINAALRSSGVGANSAVAGDPNKGGYPNNLANSDYYSPVVDPWGMYSRQCVSYTAWKVQQKTGNMPYWGGRGNANQWPGNARAAGIPVNSTPSAGSVGVIMAGQYGHVVWVDSVNSDGTINISQYNFYNAGGAGWGHYSEMYSVSPGAYDYYIHF